MYQQKTINTKAPVPDRTQDPHAITAYKLLEGVQNDKNIKVVDFNVPYRQDACIYDISMNAHAQDEDKLYAFDEKYRINLRRGNTVIQTFDDKDKVTATFYGRRGFEKFFDLTYEYVQYNLKEIPQLEKAGIKGASEHAALYDVIFKAPKKAIDENKKIAVYKLTKANGENAQVSYIKRLDAWIIASKNVSLIARNEADVELYKGERFHFATLIAKEWLRIVGQLEKDGLLDQIKAYLDGKTFVGEYCGNQKYQHLVKYTNIDIHFVAIVENDSVVTCVSPPVAAEVFRKFKLTHVQYKPLGVYDTWKDLNQTLKKVFIDVAEAPLEEEAEGSVLYLVQVGADGKEQTLSLSKLKTLEYRIYRKLREKLRGFISQKANNYRPWSEYHTKFLKETKDLCRDLKIPMPLDYYSTVAKKAFEFGENHYDHCALIHEQYITFLSLLMYQMSKDEELTPAQFTEEMMQKVLAISWADYYKVYLDKYGPEGRVTGDTSSGCRKVYVIIPIGMPGMGKTYFLKTFKRVVEANGCQLSMISSDEVRKECMDRLAKTQRNLSTDQLFDKTATSARNLFNERLKDLITKSDTLQCKAHFIFVDKNHPPNAMRGTMALIEGSSAGLNVEVVGLTPQIENNFFTYEDGGKTFQYPFSANFFMTCYDRVQTRKEHETLIGSGTKSAGVLVMFFHMFRGVMLNKESIYKNGFHKHLKVPFTAENNPTQLPSELTETLIQILRSIQPGDRVNNEQLIAKFDEIYQKARLQFKSPETKLVEEAVNGFFKQEILPDLEVLRAAKKESVAKTNTNNVTANSVAQEKREEIRQGAPKFEEKKQEVQEVKQKLEKEGTNAQVEERKQPSSKDKNISKEKSAESKPQEPAQGTVEKKNQQNNKKGGKKNKLPTYLGIFALDDPIKRVKSFVLAGLDVLYDCFPKDKVLGEICKEIEDGKSPHLQFVRDFHVTSLFIGKDSSKAETEHYKDFKYGVRMDLELVGFVIVPDKIVTAICYPDQSSAKIENKFPHMTLMDGKWSPKYSNDLFTELFDEGGPLSKEYQKKGFHTMEEFSYKVPVHVNNQNSTAYVVKFKPHLVLAAETDECF